MAVTTTVVRRSNDEVEFDITATADVDTVTGLQDHGLGLERPTPQLVMLFQQAIAEISLWALTTLNGTQFELTKAATVGSGEAVPQARLTLKRAR